MDPLGPPPAWEAAKPKGFREEGENPSGTITQADFHKEKRGKKEKRGLERWEMQLWGVTFPWETPAKNPRGIPPLLSQPGHLNSQRTAKSREKSGEKSLEVLPKPAGICGGRCQEGKLGDE